MSIEKFAERFFKLKSNVHVLLPCQKKGGWDEIQKMLVKKSRKVSGRNEEPTYVLIEKCKFSVSSFLPTKSALKVRNRNIVDRSDLVVCCIQHKNGGAYKTIQYAKKLGRKIENLADEN